MTTPNLIIKVAARMDEISLGSGDTPASIQIEKELDDSAKSLCELLPNNLAIIGKLSAVQLTDMVDNEWVYKLPVDFIRMIRFGLVGWNQYVNKTVNEDSVSNRLQQFYYLKATINKPMVIYIPDEESAVDRGYLMPLPQTITGASPVINYFHYSKKVIAEDLPDRLIDMFAWFCAGRVFSIMGSDTSSKICYEKVNELLKSSQ